MAVYVDLLILLNFAVDFLLLLGTNRLSGHPPGVGRAALSAVIGGLYAGACVLPGFAFLGSILWRIVSLAIMSVVAFGTSRSGLRRGILFLFLSMALGGLALCLGRGGFLPLVLSAGGVCLLSFAGFQGKAGQRYVPVTIRHRGQSVSVTALVDTGNTLRDPVSGCPVLVTEGMVAEKMRLLSLGEMDDPLKTMASGKLPGLRLIPYTAVGQKAGFLLGLRTDSVCINGKQMDYVVAFTPQCLGNGQYQALAGGVL